MDDKEEDILTEDSFIIYISQHPIDNEEESYNDNTLWGNKITNDFLFDIVNLLKCEMEEISVSDSIKEKDNFNRIVSVLDDFQSEFREKGDLEDVLINYIEELKEYKFKITIEELKEKFYDLRRHKIKFYERVVEEYRYNKEKFNDSLKASISTENKEL